MDSATSTGKRNFYSTRLEYERERDVLWIQISDGERYRSGAVDAWDRIQKNLDANRNVLGYTVCPLKKLVERVAALPSSKLWNALGVPEKDRFEVEGQVFNFVELVHWAAKRFGAEAAGQA